MKGYGFFSLFYLFFCRVITFFVFSDSRLIRIPFFVRGRGLINFGRGLTTGVGCRFDAFLSGVDSEIKLSFGNNVQVNDYVHIAAIEKVVIGDNVLVASKVFISDHNHGCYLGVEQSDPLTPPVERPIVSSPVIIEDNVWIGEFVSILPGVTVGKGSIIGANSVVSRNIPPYSIAVGSPAKVIKRYDFVCKQWIKV